MTSGAPAFIDLNDGLLEDSLLPKDIDKVLQKLEEPGAGLLQHRAVVALPTGDHHRQRTSVPVDRVVDLRGQPAPRLTDPVTRGFGLACGQILVVRPCPLWGG